MAVETRLVDSDRVPLRAAPQPASQPESLAPCCPAPWQREAHLRGSRVGPSSPRLDRWHRGWEGRPHTLEDTVGHHGTGPRLPQHLLAKFPRSTTLQASLVDKQMPPTGPDSNPNVAEPPPGPISHHLYISAPPPLPQQPHPTSPYPSISQEKLLNGPNAGLWKFKSQELTTTLCI